MNRYLNGLDWDPFDGIPDIFVTDHHIKGYRYFATYKNGQSRKQSIFKILAEHGVIENAGGWDWHHVVEGNHLAPLFTLSNYQLLYNLEWPTVLMHSVEEHKILNSLFRSSGTSQGLPRSTGNPLTGTRRADYIRTLYERYQDIYTGDHVLRKVVHNLISNLK